MPELREKFLLMKTNQPEMCGPLGTYSDFSKVLSEQRHTETGIELSEKGFRELKAMLTEHH